MNVVNRRQAIALLAAAGATSGAPAFSQARKKVAFVLNGTPGDVGWNFEHARGIAQAQAEFGDTVQIDSFYGVKEWGEGDADKFLELILDGYDLVFACSYGYGQSLVQLALAAPNTKFEHCGGYVRANNMSTYSARWYEGRVPQGLIAGSVTKTNRIGYLASFRIPQVIRGINAAFLAARSVNPNVEFDVVWLNTWFSPKEEEGVSNILLDRGADVLLAHTNTTKPTEVAEARGAYAFGQASDMTKYGPNATLSATINNWGPYYVRRISALLNGTWESEDTWGGFQEEMIAIGDVSGVVAPRIQRQVAAVVAGFESGMPAFVGPIAKQDGTRWLSSGQSATDHMLHSMTHYVSGMKATL